MGEKCKPSYKNLNLIQSYSEQKYATVQWCEQNCENDEWLRREVEELRYLTPPAVRYNFDINDFLAPSRSYGVVNTSDSTVGFDNSVSKVLSYDFAVTDTNKDSSKNDAPVNTLKIDTNKTSATIIKDAISIATNEDGHTYVDINESASNAIANCRLPTTTESYEVERNVETFGTASSNVNVNSFWYVGWDKSKNYYVRPDWLKSWKDSEIKAVVRAQTFKAEKTGSLESIDLKVAWNGSKVSNCGSPLYVQLWKTYNKFSLKTTWDKKKHKSVSHYIDYNKLPAESRSDWQDQVHYKNYQKYKKVTRKVKNKKGQIIKDNKGNPKTEKVYVKSGEKGKSVDDVVYVLKRQKIKWPGRNYWDSSKNKWGSDIYHPLAEAEYTKVGEDYITVVFKKPCTIKEGEHYALVFSSPLSEWKHCPRIGGWGRNCKRENNYPYGNAFLSTNNGRTWIRYGKNDEDLINQQKKSKGKINTYKKGKYTPMDFAFACNVETQAYKQATVTEFIDEAYIYFEHFYTNPVTSIGIEALGQGLISENTSVVFEVSTDGDVWVEIPYKGRLGFNPPYPTCLKIRGRLYRTDESKLVSPRLTYVEVTLDTLPAMELYARTGTYKARVNPMLGASHWGRVYAPFDFDATVECNAEIIEDNPTEENFIIIGLEDVDEKMLQCDIDSSIINEFLYSQLDNSVANSALEKAKYLTNNHEILDTFKSNKIYVKPYIEGDKLYLLSFSRSYENEDMVITKPTGTETEPTFFQDIDYPVCEIPFGNMVAYPILDMHIEPVSPGENSTTCPFSEMLDYTVDYEKNTFTFKSTTIDDLIEGNLKIKYNKCFIKNLSNNEVGVWKNEETGLTEHGLLLDYFKENILITDEIIQSRRVSLRVQPVNPIRAVYLYKDSNFDEEPKALYEYSDYTFDLDTREIVFNVSNADGVSSILSLNDTLQIIYTPNIEDDSLSIGYYATRKNVDKQVRIKDGYFEYKV